jgi:hypothetical protein
MQPASIHGDENKIAARLIDEALDELQLDPAHCPFPLSFGVAAFSFAISLSHALAHCRG